MKTSIDNMTSLLGDEADAVGFSGTSVKRGEMRAVVNAIGNQTKFARTVDLVAQSKEKSHFEKVVLKAIVSRLAAMEEMAGLSILCADKTGTLTKNELELQEPVLFDAKDGKDLILAAALTARRKEQDPIDQAILGALEDQSVLDDFQIKDFRPFDPTHKRAEADVTKDGEDFTVAKGAPQAILKLVEADESMKKKVLDKVYASQMVREAVQL